MTRLLTRVHAAQSAALMSVSWFVICTLDKWWTFQWNEDKAVYRRAAFGLTETCALIVDGENRAYLALGHS